MTNAVIHVHPSGRLLALVGSPNCGKTSLFNLLTGNRQKVANYAGVTVERKEGRLLAPRGRPVRVLDLPGTASLHPRSPDERITHDVLTGQARGERRPDLLLCVVDATQLQRHLRMVLAVHRLGYRCALALNMADRADARGLVIDPEALSRELGMPVVRTVGTQAQGVEQLRALLADEDVWLQPRPSATADGRADHEIVREILQRLGLDAVLPHTISDRVDRVALHPVVGPLLLATVLFLMFQAVFAWAEAPMSAIEAATAWLGQHVAAALPDGWLASLLVDGVIAGVGGVLVFLPQIVILFFFILLMEDSGYLPRAAFLLDRLMAGVGLSGRSFIPLLSSFACAIPGIMATRTLADSRDRRITMLIAPLMTCSARLPVYALLIGAFVPRREVAGLVELQGLVLFGLYVAGVAGAMAVAWILKRFTAAGRQARPLMMELPDYHWPVPRNVLLGLWQRVLIFLRRVGGIIFVLTILMWLLASFPAPPPGPTVSPIESSYAGQLGRLLAVVLAPLGFTWQISIALVPGLAAREVVVSALATVYALSDAAGETDAALGPLLAADWSLATALALLAWFVFAPQCLSTLATLRRETQGWAMPLAVTGYTLVLAYGAAFITYRLALALGAG
jgi:ferrous iron transport protein B